jgi:hypothetical protein
MMHFNDTGIKKSRSIVNLSFTVNSQQPEVKVLLLENISESAVEAFKKAGYSVTLSLAIKRRLNIPKKRTKERI